MNTTSVSLLERLRQPVDKEASWMRFVQLYTPLLYYWARRLGLATPDAADLVQEVFAVLVLKLPTWVYDPAKSFRGWLRIVLINKWRETKRRRTVEAGAANVVEMAELAEPDPALAFDEADYRRHLVGRALELMQAEFQPATWQACWQCVVLERAPAAVAAELNITVNSVYLAKSRVLRRLHQELHGLLD
jgi:RNA polymerase sigma-70 factor (ECF subfamily)